VKKYGYLLALSLAVTVVGGCGGDDDDDDVVQADADPGQLTVADLVGTWPATSHVYTNNASQTEQYDVIANGGTSRMTVLTGAQARTWLEYGTFSDEWDSALTLVDDRLTVDPAELSRPVRVYTIALDGDTMTLTNEADEFDFTMTGADPVPATLVITSTRE